VSTVDFQGTLVAGSQGGTDCSFPSAITNLQFGKTKSFAVSATHAKNVASASAYVPLDGVGTGETVTQANFLYLRTNAKLSARITYKADSGPDVVIVIPVFGFLVWEPPDANYITLLEMQGVGGVEYFASGNA
jgi:hypothetical protein